jgi:mannose-6-phosphate isomerase-like protein (cupin superfamily)
MNVQNLDKATMNGEVHSLEDIVSYIPNILVKAPLLRKPTGEIQIMAYAADEDLVRAISPFDNFLMLLEGSAIITLQNKQRHIQSMQCIIIPAHSSCSIKAVERFKMLSVVIKCGYE